MTDRERLYWIWLSQRTHGGTSTVNTALRYFSSPEEVWLADKDTLAASGIEWRGRMDSFLDKDLSQAEKIAEYCDKNSIGIVTLQDYFYPERLKALANRPILMYYIGNFCDIDANPCVAVVGSRRPSRNGELSAKRISYDLAVGGAVIVSGLASGIDALAHKAALYAEKFTVAVLGCGVDRVYPEENRSLYGEICEKGLVISEFAPGTPPQARNFPIRNRIISGLSAATCVIEGGMSSGSLITAEHTIRQKKPLYTVPSSIFLTQASGSNHLLKVGARPLLTAFDLLYDLKGDFPDSISINVGEKSKNKAKNKKKSADNPDSEKTGFLFGGLKKKYSRDILPPEFEGAEQPAEAGVQAPEDRTENAPPRALSFDLSEDEKTVFEALTYQPKTAEELGLELSASKTLRILSGLEIKGLAESFAGGRYALADG